MINNLNEAIRHIKAAQLMLLGKDNQPISDLYYALQIALDLMEKSKWISVTEKLPEKDGIYLVTFFTGMFNTRLCTTASYYLKCGWNMENVIYWRPMPKPEESEAENGSRIAHINN